MKHTTRFVLLLSVCVVGILIVYSCQGGGDSSPTSPSSVLLDQTVTVPGGGGNVNVSFSANSGQTIRITLTASSTAKLRHAPGFAVQRPQRSSPLMVPYGFLEYPDGTGGYYPDLQTAQEGGNMVELTLTQTGVYTLSIMDGSNVGRPVHVYVEILSAL